MEHHHNNNNGDQNKQQQKQQQQHQQQRQDTAAASPPPPFVVVQGYVRFVCDILIPGVIQSFCKDNFNIKDANQWRSVSEFAGLLEILQKRLVDVYYQEVLVGKFANHLGCPAPVVEGFRTASNRKDMESSLRNLIEQSHQHEWRSMS